MSYYNVYLIGNNLLNPNGKTPVKLGEMMSEARICKFLAKLRDVNDMLLLFYRVERVDSAGMQTGVWRASVFLDEMEV